MSVAARNCIKAAGSEARLVGPAPAIECVTSKVKISAEALEIDDGSP